MKVIVFLICIMLLAVPVSAKTIIFGWDAPVTNEDGTTLTDLAGHKLYDNGVEVKDCGLVTQCDYDVPEGSHSFTVRAYDDKGNESVDSNAIVYELQICPAPDTNFRIIPEG